MKFTISSIKQALSGIFAAGGLPPVPLPKGKPKQQSLPGFRDSIEVKTSALTRLDRQLSNKNRLDARTLGDTRKTILELSKSSPDLSSAVSFMLRTGIPEDYCVVAMNMDTTINTEATSMALELLARMTFLGNADGSFGKSKGLQTLSEELGLEFILYGAACLEVALDKARVPANFAPVSVTGLKFYEEDESYKLVQDIGGTELDLDLPTIIYVAVDQLQTEVYASSYMESAIQPLLADIDFNNDMRRILKRTVWPRIMAVIDSEVVKKMTPPEILADSDKLIAYRNALITEIDRVLSNTNPEDALVGYDSVTYSYLENTGDPGKIVEDFQRVLNGKLAAGAKTLPIILGHAVTSNAASAESMLYIKQANMLRVKLNEIYSRALTIACRLLGQDVYVEFKYDHISIRPDAELESFKSMKQARVLELLSLGMLGDEEACLMLTNGLPAKGYKPLTGTMFYKPDASAVKANPTSNTSAQEQSLSGDSPKGKKS